MGLSPQRSKGLLGSYDPEKHVLTIVQYSQPAGARNYLNEAWQIQQDPYTGDVANCYNDGPPAPGKPHLGHFYEMESASPAAALGPNQTVTHIQRTIHINGSEQDLAKIARTLLDVSLDQVENFHR